MGISNYLETNVTEVTVLNTAGVKIDMTNLTDPIQTKEPYKKQYSYSNDDLQCKQWSKVLNRLTSSGCEALVVNSTLLMCQTCDSTTLTTTNVSHCYCDSLEYLAAHYNKPSEVVTDSDIKMVYPDYYALEYITDSFGFALVICVIITYIPGLFVVLFLDQFPRRKILIKIYEKIKRREVIEGYTEEDDTLSSECDSSTELDDPSTAMISKYLVSGTLFTPLFSGGRTKEKKE